MGRYICLKRLTQVTRHHDTSPRFPRCVFVRIASRCSFWADGARASQPDDKTEFKQSPDVLSQPVGYFAIDALILPGK